MRRSIFPVLVFASFLPFAYSQMPQTTPCAVQTAPVVTEADNAFAAGDFAHAETLFAAATSKTPATYAGLVNSQLEQNKLREALASADKAAADLPASADAHALVGLALIRAGEIAKVSPVLASAFAIDHCSPMTLFAFARFNQLFSRHLTAQHELAIAHHLAPWNAAIAAAWILSLPLKSASGEEERTPALRAFLASKPALPPNTLSSLTNQLAILEAHLTCVPAYATQGPVNLTLEGLTFYGTRFRGYGLKSRINNVDMPLLDIDSSVSGIVFNPADAQKAGVHPLAGQATAQDGISWAIADHIKIGGVDYQNCPVQVAPAADLANSYSLIGTDFFRDRLIKIDYVQRTLTLTPYAAPAIEVIDRTIPPGEKDWSPVLIEGSNMLLPTLLNKKSPVLMLFDTGAHATIFSASVGKLLLSGMRDHDSNIHGFSGSIVKTIPKFTGSSYDDDPEVTGPNGKLLGVTTPLKSTGLSFANTSFLEPFSLSFDLTPKSHDTGIEIGGLLGFAVLREYFIDLDYRNGLVHMLYDYQHLYTSREFDPTHRPQ